MIRVTETGNHKQKKWKLDWDLGTKWAEKWNLEKIGLENDESPPPFQDLHISQSHFI